MNTPPTTRQIQADTDTPALCRKLAQLLTVWQQIEAEKVPEWKILCKLETAWIAPTKTVRQLKHFNLISEKRNGRGFLQTINRDSIWSIADFISDVDGKYFEPEGTRETTINTIIERCQAIGHKSGLPFALWTTITAEPHTSGQAATAVGCSPGEASKALGKLVDCGLAHAPIHKGQFRIYRGIDGLGFLQDAQSLVEAGIIKL